MPGRQVVELLAGAVGLATRSVGWGLGVVAGLSAAAMLAAVVVLVAVAAPGPGDR